MPIGFHRFRRPGPVYSFLPVFLLLGRALLPATERPCVFSGVEKIVAVGDLHGAYESFVEILQEMRIVDDDLHWIAGKTHLVQMGDIMDRGPKAREIFDLIRNLEHEAREAGGRVHMLIGNHEEMNILGLSFEIKGFVTAEQFRSFLPDRLRERKEKEFRALAGPDADLSPFWEKWMEENSEARDAYTNFFNEQYGGWIADHSTVIRINEVAFVHGGLSESLSVQTCGFINSGVSEDIKRYLRDKSYQGSWIYQPTGPLWHRDLASKDENTIREETDRILSNLGAKAIVLGHTPTTGTVSLRKPSRLGEKIWIIDTGIWMKEHGQNSALVIENGQIHLMKVPSDGRRGRR
jgi:hypothetical protein